MPKKRKKKIPKASKKRLMVFGTISVIVILYFIFSFGYNVYRIYVLKQEQKQLQQEYTELKKDEKELRNEIEKLQDEDYIARYARENYSYSKDGEYIIKINEEESKQTETKKLDINIDYNYIIYGGVFIIFIIIVHTLRKRK